MKNISLLSTLSFVILPDESGIEDLNFENSVQKRDSRFHGNDNGDGRQKRWSDKTFFVILPDESGIGDWKLFDNIFLNKYVKIPEYKGKEDFSAKLLVTNYCEWWKDGYPKKSYLNIIDLKKLLEGK